MTVKDGHKSVDMVANVRVNTEISTTPKCNTQL